VRGTLCICNLGFDGDDCSIPIDICPGTVVPDALIINNNNGDDEKKEASSCLNGGQVRTYLYVVIYVIRDGDVGFLCHLVHCVFFSSYYCNALSRKISYFYMYLLVRRPRCQDRSRHG
jgi:hypothetical protein